MPTNKALLHRCELRLVGLDIDIDVLQLADLLAIAIDEHLAVPLGHTPLRFTLSVGHVSLLVSVHQPRTMITAQEPGPASRLATRVNGPPWSERERVMSELGA